MSKKAKYKAQERDGDYGRIYTVEKKGVAISSSWTITAARKIARALNAMEAKKPSRNSLQWRPTK